jgi:hypothetical protein
VYLQSQGSREFDGFSGRVRRVQRVKLLHVAHGAAEEALVLGLAVDADLAARSARVLATRKDVQ